MIHLLKVLVKKIAKQSNITVIPCLLIYFSLDRLLLYLIFLNFARDKQYVLGTISIINIMKPTNFQLLSFVLSLRSRKYLLTRIRHFRLTNE